MQIAVLGAGMVGSAIAKDLSLNYEVTSFDISETSLRRLAANGKINTEICDLCNYDAYSKFLAPFQWVVCAVPGFMGYQALEAIINAGKNVVDISFFPEDALQLDALAKAKGVTAIVDCGVAPGMSNLILGYHDSMMKVSHFECLVGGLPKQRVLPFEYKAPFSPIDVIEEYTRTARFVEQGQLISKPALSDIEWHDLPQVGTLESFNSDGLRSLLFTMPHIPNMKEKTLRYPGHADLMKAFFKAGFMNREPVLVDGQKVVPLQFTSKLLFDQWKLEEQDEEFTLMKISISGEKDGTLQHIKYFLYDETDKTSGTSSMSRTTGYACNAALNVLIDGLFTETGVFPPELLGKSETCYLYMMQYLKERKVIYHQSIT